MVTIIAYLIATNEEVKKASLVFKEQQSRDYLLTTAREAQRVIELLQLLFGEGEIIRTTIQLTDITGVAQDISHSGGLMLNRELTNKEELYIYSLDKRLMICNTVN